MQEVRVYLSHNLYNLHTPALRISYSSMGFLLFAILCSKMVYSCGLFNHNYIC